MVLPFLQRWHRPSSMQDHTAHETFVGLIYFRLVENSLYDVATTDVTTGCCYVQYLIVEQKLTCTIGIVYFHTNSVQSNKHVGDVDAIHMCIIYFCHI